MEKVIQSGVSSNLYQPLSQHEIERIHESALTVLETIGMGDGIPILHELAAEKGCEITEEGRIKFPRALVEDVLAGACRSFVFHGREAHHDMEISGSRVNFGTAGAAVQRAGFQHRSLPALDPARHLRFWSAGRSAAQSFLVLANRGAGGDPGLDRHGHQHGLRDRGLDDEADRDQL